MKGLQSLLNERPNTQAPVREKRSAAEQLPSETPPSATKRPRAMIPASTSTREPKQEARRVLEKELKQGSEELLSRGAEAVVTRISYLGRLAVRKQRFRKSYRHPELDAKLTARRLQQEARILLRLRKSAILVPAVYSVDVKEATLILQYIHGLTLKAFLHTHNDSAEGVMRIAGRAVARMHNADVVHGDLTTSNIIITTDHDVCMIDFGLSCRGSTEEDLAVDLYVLERAVISTHSEQAQPLNDAFLQAYSSELCRPAVLKRLEQVRARGRKRDMTG